MFHGAGECEIGLPRSSEFWYESRHASSVIAKLLPLG